VKTSTGPRANSESGFELRAIGQDLVHRFIQECRRRRGRCKGRSINGSYCRSQVYCLNGKIKDVSPANFDRTTKFFIQIDIVPVKDALRSSMSDLARPCTTASPITRRCLRN
jgi:hypothetical protein